MSAEIPVSRAHYTQGASAALDLDAPGNVKTDARKGIECNSVHVTLSENRFTLDGPRDQSADFAGA